MPILYPASLDSLTNPASSDTLAGVPHATQHADSNDAIEALETKLGTGASVPATPGHVLRVSGPGGAEYAAIQDADLPVTIARNDDVTDAVTAHEALPDPHTGYQKESEKAAASGYASLDASTKVPIAQIPTGATSSTVATGDHQHTQHSFVGCVATRTTDQTGVVTATNTAIVFNGTEDFDTDGFHDPAINPSRITIPSGKGGKYRFSAAVTWDTDPTGYRRLLFKKNGITDLCMDTTDAVDGTQYTLQTVTTPPFSLVAGDYIEVMAYQTSGANRTISGSVVACRFGAEFLGA